VVDEHSEILEKVLEHIKKNPECQIFEIYDALEILSMNKAIQICDELERQGKIVYT